jgi:hypothetical protein
MSGHRTCKVCGEIKPKNQFAPQGYQCRQCRTKRQRAYYAALPPKTAEERKKAVETTRRWRERNLEVVREKSRIAHIKRKFGLSAEEYDRMLQEQNGVCAICGMKCKTGFNLAVDHNHDTGKIRGLLCKNCNTALGLLKENPENMLKAIEYLRQHSESDRVS